MGSAGCDWRATFATGFVTAIAAGCLGGLGWFLVLMFWLLVRCCFGWVQLEECFVELFLLDFLWGDFREWWFGCWQGSGAVGEVRGDWVVVVN